MVLFKKNSLKITIQKKFNGISKLPSRNFKASIRIIKSNFAVMYYLDSCTLLLVYSFLFTKSLISAITNREWFEEEDITVEEKHIRHLRGVYRENVRRRLVNLKRVFWCVLNLFQINVWQDSD